MRNFKVDSTAIENLSVEGDQVSIQFTSTFIADLEKVIADPNGSVGSYIHRTRKNNLLIEV
jgi:hypothetical protein